MWISSVYSVYFDAKSVRGIVQKFFSGEVWEVVPFWEVVSADIQVHGGKNCKSIQQFLGQKRTGI